MMQNTHTSMRKLRTICLDSPMTTPSQDQSVSASETFPDNASSLMQTLCFEDVQVIALDSRLAIVACCFFHSIPKVSLADLSFFDGNAS